MIQHKQASVDHTKIKKCPKLPSSPLLQLSNVIYRCPLEVQSKHLPSPQKSVFVKKFFKITIKTDFCTLLPSNFLIKVEYRTANAIHECKLSHKVMLFEDCIRAIKLVMISNY